MPIYRAPDGKIIEERTKKVSADTLTTRVAPAGAAQDLQDDDRTRRIGADDGAVPVAPRTAASPAAPAHAEDSERTRYVNLGSRQPGKVADAMSDPVVGWLVIVGGPGSGNALALGYGANTIGRGDTNRVCLDFGDDLVTRSGHAVLTYDPRGRKFYLQQGPGASLVYIDEQPVLTPREIEPRTRIMIGNTQLYFQPLCGEHFDWQDVDGLRV